jgi:hypothetical protein
MVYLLLVIATVSISDIRDLVSQNRKKDLYVYAVFMLLVAAFAIFYFSDPARDSFSKIIFSIAGKGD